ncbi:hypothetical protein QBC38DRAFT_258412 [Podospora fimiseda]|uniref:Uncharacterized protein n=1 Tax=Podospora fimiseda TaxID=252190 RepID=A0AAN7BWT6_9PEZI|nr:hypothetical protein QBC38DRAFT_258412 [Podospora fimiseda]
MEVQFHVMAPLSKAILKTNSDFHYNMGILILGTRSHGKPIPVDPFKNLVEAWSSLWCSKLPKLHHPVVFWCVLTVAAVLGSLGTVTVFLLAFPPGSYCRFLWFPFLLVSFKSFFFCFFLLFPCHHSIPPLLWIAQNRCSDSSATYDVFWQSSGDWDEKKNPIFSMLSNYSICPRESVD